MKKCPPLLDCRIQVCRLLLSVLTLALMGCGYSEPPAVAFADYRKAVAQALDVPSEHLAPYPPFALIYPDRAERTASTAEVNVNVRSFWSFKHCDIRARIAQRNTALGRANSAVVQLPYEHELLQTLHTCLAELDPEAVSDSVLASLRDVAAKKTGNRDAVYWNSTFGSREFVQLFSPSAARLPADAASVFVPIRELELLVDFADQFGEHDAEISISEVVDAYAALERSGYGARLLKSLHEASFYLQAVNSLLERRLAGAPLCFRNAPGKTARELQQAFRRYHVRVTQPYLASIGRTAGPWLRAMDELATSQRAVLPEGFVWFYQRYLQTDHPNGLWQQHLKHIRQHAYLWTQVFDQCGLTLG